MSELHLFDRGRAPWPETMYAVYSYHPVYKYNHLKSVASLGDAKKVITLKRREYRQNFPGEPYKFLYIEYSMPIAKEDDRV